MISSSPQRFKVFPFLFIPSLEHSSLWIYLLAAQGCQTLSCQTRELHLLQTIEVISEQV